MGGQLHPNAAQRSFFEAYITGQDKTILTLKRRETDPRGFSINIRGPFKLADYKFPHHSETVIDAEWAGEPESNAHLHCSWNEINFARVTKTNEKVQENIGYYYQIGFFSTKGKAETGKVGDSVFWFYLEDQSHKIIQQGLLDKGVIQISTQGGTTADCETKHLPSQRTDIAPDGSDVRVLLGLAGGGMAHFELPANQVSRAVTYRTVEEIWFFLSGRGEMWRSQGGQSAVVDVYPGVCLTIPLGTHFQFRSLGGEALTAVGVTMPPWPGDGEAVPVIGEWQPTVPDLSTGA